MPLGITKKSQIKKRHSSLLFNFLDELKENTSIDNIYFSSEKDNKSYFRYNKKNSNKRELKGLNNIKRNISNIEKKNSDMIFVNNYKRKALSSIDNIQNIKRNNLDKMEIEEKKKVKRIYTNKRMELYDELTNKIYKIKKFNEDEIPFTSSKILPEIQWQDIDNDILTDDDQLKRSRKKELNWIGETIKLIQKNENYLTENIQRKKCKNKNRKKHI